jgi:gamma-glutamyltranspeptidase / glutathione hydrolase
MTTSNGSCAGVVVPGWGVGLNNMLGEEDLNPAGFHALPPGRRMGSMMAPTIVEEADGGVVALGSGGSERIRSALLAVLVRLLDLGEPLPAAVAAARMHPDGDHSIQVEPGLPGDVLAALRATGTVHAWDVTDLYFGGVHAVRRSPDGSVLAVGDHRRGGAVAVVPRGG